MEFKEITKRALEIRDAYSVIEAKRNRPWGATERMQGLVGDVGALMKLVMAKDNLRDAKDLEQNLKHELSDCLWSIIVIADELGIDLENEFMGNMNEIQAKIKKNDSVS